MKGFQDGYLGEVLSQIFDEYGDTVNTRVLWEDQASCMTAAHYGLF
jgi:hypothetical protein